VVTALVLRLAWVIGEVIAGLLLFAIRPVPSNASPSPP
jgi:hypothetical protein